MKKLLQLHDRYTLKVLVAFLILFVALYPKLPSVHIIRTWVYIRLEDFAILATLFVWLIQLTRRKISLPLPFVFSIGGFWLIGLISTIYAVIFLAPHLANFFPHLAFLQYMRRVEYMVLFFIAFSTIRSQKDVRDYFIVLSATLIAVFLYGLGQHYYLYAWSLFPKFFEQYPFCFPSFQTGNEEFAKGIPLCLPKDARITSTFGGNYDLSAYIVLVLPIFIATFVSVKKRAWKIVHFLLFIAGLMVLLFTASRTSFMAYLIGAIVMLILFKKKLFIIPVLLVSVGLLVLFSQSTAKRLSSTFRVSSVVTTKTGQLVGELPQNLQNKVASQTAFVSPPPAQNLETGSAIISLPSTTAPVKTNVAVVKKTVTADQAKKLQLANGSVEISSVSGSFYVQKALVYDISFTTRLQAEWPNAWRAFMSNPLLGSGYSSITLATDGDYLRALGETGILGFSSFIIIFVLLGITLKKAGPAVESPLTRGLVYGLAGGFISLSLNAILIDVFEASKVAETLWLLLGICAGGLLVGREKSISYLMEFKKFALSKFMMSMYLIILVGFTLFSSIGNFFVGDDFVWLHWAASSSTHDIVKYFTNAQGFFYRPLDKTITFFLYSVFSFQPQGYHIVLLLLHIIGVIGVYLLAGKITKNQLISFSCAVLFALLPAHAENVFWFSSLSSVLGSVALIYVTLAYVHFRTEKSIISYLLALMCSVIAFLSYEIATAVLAILFVIDLFFSLSSIRKMETYLSYIPFIFLYIVYAIIRVVTHAFSGGGDYSYSIIHFVPNLVGNFFGYIGLFVEGEAFLPFYEALRQVARLNIILFALLVFVVCSLFMWGVYRYRLAVKVMYKNAEGRIILFGIGFGFAGLLPFLGLGNIAERYLYLASVGFCLAFTVIIWELIKRIEAYKTAIFIGIIILLAVWYQIQNVKAQTDWQHAGEITKNTLAEFRINYESLSPENTVYIVNKPIKYKNAWVFPVGLPDGIWFIYRDTRPRIFEVSSIDEAEAKNPDPIKDYVLQFDQNGKLSLVK